MSFEEVDFENLDDYQINIKEVDENKIINNDSGIVISASSLEQLTHNENTKWKKINTKLNEFIDDTKESDFQMKIKKAMKLKKKFNDSINNNEMNIKPIFIQSKVIHTPMNDDSYSQMKFQPNHINNIFNFGTFNDENSEIMGNLIGSLTNNPKLFELFQKYGEKIMSNVQNDPNKYILDDYSSNNPLTKELMNELSDHLNEILAENPDLGESLLKFSDELKEKYDDNPELKDKIGNSEYLKNIFKNIESIKSSDDPFKIGSIIEPIFGKTVEFSIPMTAELKQNPYTYNLQPPNNTNLSLFTESHTNIQPYTTISNLNSNSINSDTIILNNLSSTQHSTLTSNIHTIPINTAQYSHVEPNPNIHPTMFHLMPELYIPSKKPESHPIKKKKKYFVI